MGRKISRRDFLHGAVGSLVAGAALAPGCSQEQSPPPAGPVGKAGAPFDRIAYPPSRLGPRGSHAGSFETAHQMGHEKRTDWGPVAEPDAGEYDLVVVGAGVSGLAAAFFYREQHPGARVLLLENHDDFGGHAKRNEFEWNGRTILGYGGSQSLEAPGAYSDVAQGLLTRIGVETARLEDAYDQGFYRRHGLAPGVYFDRATYGTDRLVRTDFMDPSAFLPVARSGVPIEDAIAEMPLSEPARRELQRLISASDDRLQDQSIFREPGYLQSISYRDFLTKDLGVEQPEVIALLQDVPSGYFGHGIDAVPALEALGFGLPGLGSTSLGDFEGLIRRGISLALEPYVYHFPDGNASVARLLVRRLIPTVADGSSMEDVVTAEFDYQSLDRPGADVRLRLDSTVVRVEHEGAPRSAERVAVTYVRAGRTERVRARRVILACYNRVVPLLCPELPDAQKAALGSLVKIPLVYTNVLLRNWRPFQELGLALAHCPGSWHRLSMLDFPVSLGGYGFSAGPDDPIVLHMSRTMVHPGLKPRDQSRVGRSRMLATSFETIEREIRIHLGGMLGAGGFDPARDIEGIAVNRWPHGYAFHPNPLFDPEYGPGEAPHEIGRQRFGRIAIANSDAGARAYLDCAIDQAWRAVGELSA
ncbi:MAG: NAD(P)-binding protein [Deltaproteobacteria bacterium]|nr:NAD(P)-binding protein [Deltaproteobacteria bacterium]